MHGKDISRRWSIKKNLQKKTDLPTRKETSQKDVFARNFDCLEPAWTEGASTHLKTDVYIRKETYRKDRCTNNVSLCIICMKRLLHRQNRARHACFSLTAGCTNNVSTSRVSLREASKGGESRVSGPSTAVVPSTAVGPGRAVLSCMYMYVYRCIDDTYLRKYVFKLYVYICIYMYELYIFELYVYICMCTYTYVYVYMYIHVYVYICIYVYTGIYTFTNMSIYACVYMCIHVCVCVRTRARV